MPTSRTDDRFLPGVPGRNVEEAVQAFDEAWSLAQEPPLQQFLPYPSHPARLSVLTGLIKWDQRWRFRSCCGELLESYVARWPELTHSLAVQAELLKSECLWRGTHVEMPEQQELAARFPTLAPLLDWKELEAQAATHRARDSYLGTGRFFLIRRIGKGGMGVVYAALDRQRQAIVALKRLPKISARSVYSFKREFRLLAEIVHPNLVPLYDLVSDSRTWFFTMELIDGVDFMTYIRGYDRQEEDSDTISSEEETATWSSWIQLDFERLRAALCQLAEGVRTLHRAGKLHRDIKPSNVLVKPDGTVVLLDFGLITELFDTDSQPFPAAEGVAGEQEASPAQCKTEGGIVGTASYMSPEQAAGHRLTAASDWYSVGVMLYELLAGCRPFTGPRAAILKKKQEADAPPLPGSGKGVPSDIAALCYDLLARDPQARPSDDEVLKRLNAQPGSTTETIPFVGRKEYLTALHDKFSSMLAGTAVTVCIAGRSGVGKTRLVQHFVQQLIEQHQAVVLAGRCYERETVPYKALDSLMDSLARYLGWLPPSHCDALLPTDIAALARVFPALGTISSVSKELGVVLGTIDPQQMRRRAFHALRELLTRLGNQVPLVLCIDDLQWGDADSGAVLAEIMRPPHPPRLLLLVSYRSEHEDDSACLQALEQWRSADDELVLEVEPLSPGDSRQLINMLLPGRRDSHLIRRIAREGEGSPYFIAELVRHATEAAGAGEDAALTSPIGLDGMLWQRVQQLPQQPRRLLESICVAGCPVSIRTAYLASGVEVQNERALAILKAGHFVRTAGPDLEDEIEVFHDRIRETVVGRLGADVLTVQHAELAVVLERDKRADLEAIAFHYHAGGNAARSAYYYRMAADQASHALAFSRAAQLYRLALELDPESVQTGDDTHEKLAGALASAGWSAEAAIEYRAAAEQATGLKRLQLQREAAYQYLISGHFDTGREVLAEVLKAVGMSLPATPRGALWSLLWRRLQLRLRGLKFRPRSPEEIPPLDLARLDICWSASIGLAIIDVIRGSDYQTRCVLHALRAGEPLRITRALALESIFTAARGTRTVQRTRYLLEAAERTAARVQEPYAEAVVRLAQSGVAMLTGQYRLSCERSEEAEKIFRNRCTGTAWELDTAHTYRLWSLIWRGEAEEIGRVAPVLVDEAQQRGDLFAMTNLRTYTIPQLLLWADKPDEARSTLHDALEQWSRKAFFAQHLLAMASSAETELYCGDGQAAWDMLAQRWPAYQASLLDRIQYGYIQLIYARARSALLIAKRDPGRIDLLRSAARDAQRLSRERRVDAEAMAAAVRAGLAMCQKNVDEGAAQLTTAADRFSDMEMSLHAAAARRSLGSIVGGEDGRAMIEQAEAVMLGKSVKDPHRLTAALVPGCCLD